MRVDFLHLLRTLRRSPASAIAAVVTLALTLGAGASIYAVVDAVLVTPPPFNDPEALVILGETPIDAPLSAPRAVSHATFEAWRDRAGSLAALEAFDGTNLTLTELGDAERVSASDVTPGFLTMLGITPMLGRTFTPGDVGEPVVIISHEFWRGRLAADPAVMGRRIVLGRRAHAIVGVLPEQFFFALNQSDVWRPLPLITDPAARRDYRVRVVARLARHVSPAYLSEALNDAFVASPGQGLVSAPRVVAKPVVTVIAGDATRTISLLAGAAAVALVIAFTNLAGLLILRSVDRQRELAVRSALGARRSDVARQLLLESLAIVVLGTIGGVLLALWLTPVAGRLVLEQFGAVANREIAVSWPVVALVSILAAACGCLVALLPAVMSARRNVVELLRRGVTNGPRELVLRRLLVIGEVALALVLLVSMTLLGGSLWRLLKVNPGFDAQGLLALQISLPSASYAADRVSSFYESLQGALADRLGPGAVSIVNEIPLTEDGGRRTVGEQKSGVVPDVVVREARPGYFDVMRIPTVAGRTFESRDSPSAPRRVVLSQSLAARLFDSEPIGRRIVLFGTGQESEIIGVVGDVKHRALDEATLPTLYLSASQAPSFSNVIVVRSDLPAADVIAAVREEVARLDRNLPLYRIRSMSDVVDASPGLPVRRLLTATFTGFAVLAVVLGAIGLFGVVAHDVARRRAELALRMALGADPGRILRTTLGQGVWMVGLGLMAGAILSFWATRALSAMLFAPDPLDVVSVFVAAMMLLLVGIGAVLPASLRAARTDPMIAIRAE
jgi:putative ABC transport system permease protein